MAEEQELKVVVSMVDKISANLTSTQKKLENFSQSATKVGTAFTAVGAAAVAGVAVTVKAFQEQERAEARLDQIATKVTGSTEEQIQAFKDQASALQQVGVIGDEVLIAGQSQIASFTKSSEVVSELTDDIADLAVAQYGTNVSQEQAIQTSNLLGKALQGQLGALTRTGILVSEDFKKAFEDANTEQERAVIISQIVQDNYGGLNQRMRETSEGGVQALKNSFGDLMEVIGGIVVPVVNELSAKLRPLVDNLIAWIQENPELAQTIAKVALAVGAVSLVVGPLLLALGAIVPIIGLVSSAFTVLSGILTAVGVALGILFSPIGAIVAAIAGLIAVGVLLYKHWDVVKEKADSIWDSVQKKFEQVGDSISEKMDAVRKFFTSAWEAIKSVTETTMNIIKSIVDGVMAAIMTVVDLHLKALEFLFMLAFGGIILLFDALGIDIISVVQNAVSTVIDKFRNMKETVTTVVTNLSNSLTEKFNAIKQFLSDIVSAIKDSITSKFREIRDSITNQTDKAASSFRDTFNSIGDFLRGKLNEFISSVQTFAQPVVDIFNSVWEGIRNGASAAFSSISDIVRGAVNGVLSGVNGIIRSVNSIAAKAEAIPGVDNVPQLPEIPAFAKGVNNFGGGLAIVGENGAEMVNLPKGSDVIPNRQTRDLLENRRGGGGTQINVYQTRGETAEELAARIQMKLRFTS